MEKREKLRMEYVPTVLVDFREIMSRTVPSREVHSRGEGNYENKPLANQDRFGPAYVFSETKRF